VSQYADKTMTCRDCGKQFTFTAGEQEFYAQRGFSEPARCGECRQARKAGRESGGYSSSDYGSGSSRGSYGDSGYGGRSGGYSSGSGYGSGGSYGSQGRNSGSALRQMFKATCADCGTTTEVPFEPRQGRPVYCRYCFERRNPRR
jgi:CxxC-x17-CxxC domain-containing protein